jgi:hypothetical protein
LLCLKEGDASDIRLAARIFVFSLIVLPASRYILPDGGIPSSDPKDETDEGQVLRLFNLGGCGLSSGGPRPPFPDRSAAVSCKHDSLQHFFPIWILPSVGTDFSEARFIADIFPIVRVHVIVFETGERARGGGRIGGYFVDNFWLASSSIPDFSPISSSLDVPQRCPI